MAMPNVEWNQRYSGGSAELPLMDRYGGSAGVAGGGVAGARRGGGMGRPGRLGLGWVRQHRRPVKRPCLALLSSASQRRLRSQADFQRRRASTGTRPTADVAVASLVSAELPLDVLLHELQRRHPRCAMPSRHGALHFGGHATHLTLLSDHAAMPWLMQLNGSGGRKPCRPYRWRNCNRRSWRKRPCSPWSERLRPVTRKSVSATLCRQATGGVGRCEPSPGPLRR